jgi:hypothetical protein
MKTFTTAVVLFASTGLVLSSVQSTSALSTFPAQTFTYVAVYGGNVSNPNLEFFNSTGEFSKEVEDLVINSTRAWGNTADLDSHLQRWITYDLLGFVYFYSDDKCGSVMGGMVLPLGACTVDNVMSMDVSSGKAVISTCADKKCSKCIDLNTLTTGGCQSNNESTSLVLRGVQSYKAVVTTGMSIYEMTQSNKDKKKVVETDKVVVPSVGSIFKPQSIAVLLAASAIMTSATVLFF